MDPLPGNIASNVKRLREQLGLSQQQVSQVAGVPRPTWANLESGQANPTISVLTKVASALNVNVEALLRPAAKSARLHPAESLPTRKRGRVAVRSLLPKGAGGLSVERLSLPPKAQLAVTPHARGSRKYVACEVGDLEVVVSGDVYACQAGDVLVYRGDQSHTLRNVGRGGAVAYCVLAFSGTD